MPLPPGDRVGRYVIDTPIGEGPRGIVYRATREGGGRTVALKVLGEEASAYPAQVIASVRSAAALDHPNIAAVVEVGEHGDHVYIARDFVRGTSAIARKAETSLEGRIRWLIEAATAVHAAHMRGVTHGALTEGNVLVEEDGTLKLTDFALRDAAEAPGDRRAWTKLARALIGEGELTPSMREAIDSTDAEGSLVYAASALERALSATGDAPIAAEIAPAGTMRGVTTRPGASPNVMRFVVPLSIIAASLVALYLTRRAQPPPVSTDGGVAPVSSTTRGASPSTQATALFNGAMQSMHDASTDLARASLNEALRIDPSFAAAHLRRALVSIEIDDTSREHFGRATSLRNALSRHERTLLDAFEPVMRSVPAVDVSVTRMEEAVARDPDDVDFTYHLGFARWLAGDFRGAIAAMDRALALDGHMAAASRARGYLLALIDQAPQAIAEYEHCLTLSPAATSCLFNLADAQAHGGDCLGMEASARRMIAISPSSPNGYRFLVRALAAQHQDDAVVVAMGEQIRRAPPESRVALEAELETKQAVLRGDFAHAERSTQAWDDAMSDVSDEWLRYAVTEMRMELALETGRPRAALDAGSAFLARHSALTGAPLHSDVRILVQGTMHRARGVSNTALNARRNDARIVLLDGGTSWRATERAQESWILAYITSVDTPSEARDALAMLPAYPALPPELLRHPVEVDGMIGRIYFLAGDFVNAIAMSRRAARSCFALDAPLFQTQVTRFLADAEAAQGDTSNACADYAEVLRRWGASTLPSESASAAKTAFARLGCERR